MTARLICVLAAILIWDFSRIKQHFSVFKGKYWSIAVKKMDYIPTAHNRNYA